jgi:hypothetical protein
MQDTDLFGSPLPLPTHTRYAELGIGPDASNDDVRWAKSALVSRLLDEQRALERERDRGRTAEDLDELGHRIEALGRQAREVNRWDVDKPDARYAYDCAHPPLALLKLEDCGDGGLTERRTYLFLMRSAMAESLEAQGEAVLHPSDLTRQDFTGDFSFHPLLDGE